MRFCNGCASPLRRACPRCGAENPCSARFCGQCTLPLDALALPLRSEPAERRQLTVLFCDLVGSTALSEALDPEDLCTVVRHHQQVCSRVIEAFDGHVAQYLGDGILVYFGYPRVHEDAARRAVLAAIEMVREIEALQVPVVEGPVRRLQLRVGIHTGLAVIGEVGGRRRERLALGGTPNIAARIQASAAPGTIAVSQTTLALVRGFVECEELGEYRLKGLSRPMTLHRVLAASGAQTRLAAAAPAGLSPFVGRSRELQELASCWAEVGRGRGRAVLLEGEPGLGKSRVLAELQQRLSPAPLLTLACACAADSENSALRPLIESIERELGLDPLRSAEAKYARVLSAFGRELDAEGAATLAALLSIELPHAPADTTPALKRQRTLAFLVRWLRGFAQRGPVLLIFEDLHWADPSTLEFIERLLAECADWRLLLLLTHRPEFTPPWAATNVRLRRLTLAPLTAADTLTLIAGLAGDAPLTADAARAIQQRTDGVPLFIEELTRSVLEDPELRAVAPHGQTPAIPSSIRDLLSARLERLGPLRATAQLAATIGREFAVDLLAAVRPADGDAAGLEAELEQLVQAQLIQRLGGAASRSYAFRHALIRDAAYDSLLRPTRREYHRLVAEALAQRFKPVVAQRPELLARHFAGARMITAAVEYFGKAAAKALERSANREAIAHARAGIALLPQLKGDDVREAAELSLLMSLGTALIAHTGFGSNDVGAVYARARELCERLPGSSEVFAARWGSWVFRLVRGELREARDTAERMLTLGELAGDSGMLVEAHWTLGDALFWLGDLRGADQHLARAAALYDREQHRVNVFRFGQDPGVTANCYHAFALCLSGSILEARAALARAAALASGLSHAFTTAWVEAFRFMLAMFLREPKQALECAERVIEFSTREAQPFWLSSATVVAGWARATLGELEAGLAIMRQGLDFYEATGSGVVQPLWYALMAEVLLANGRLGETEAALCAGQAKADAHGEELATIELARLRGQLAVARRDIGAARSQLSAALRQAERLGARTLALRVALAQQRLFADADGGALAALVVSFDGESEYPELRAARQLAARVQGFGRLHN
jgi:class 3 adenylate cyclase/predicted ATPase